MSHTLPVEVAWARAGAPVIVALRVAPGTTVGAAIAQSGLLQRCPEIDLARCGVGVFGVARALDAPVAAGDRVEIWRPLARDPKERRRQAARR